jgi:hypothetical protein
MALLVAVGVVGLLLHVRVDLTAENTIVIERFLRGAPPLAPLLFADMGMIGLVVLLDPVERVRRRHQDAPVGPAWKPI